MNKHVLQSDFKTPEVSTGSLPSSRNARTKSMIRKGWCYLIAIATLVSVAFSPSAAMAQNDGERKAVLATLNSWNEGWAQRDAALAVKDYADDTDWTNAFGDRFESRADLQAGLEFIFSLDFVMAGDSEENEYEDVRFLSDKVAL
ncbi:MAG TPA: hypothetical protein PKM48_14775, partial [Parvularculaceae bacterium]|nr:hypothetical protein [Parvularculaceae bacterium]